MTHGSLGTKKINKRGRRVMLYRKKVLERLYIQFFLTALFAMPFNSVIEQHKEVIDKTKHVYACLYLIKKQQT